MTTATITEEAPKTSLLAKITDGSDVPVDTAKPEKVAATEPASTETVTPANSTPVEIVLKVPDKSPLGESDVKAITEFAKAKGFTQDMAQALLDREVDRAKSQVSEQQVARNKLYDEWSRQVEEDTEIGGAKLNHTIENAQRALSKFNPKLAEMLRSDPLGSHPEVLRFLSNVGETLREDSGLTGSPPASKSNLSPGRALYPHMYQ